MKKYLFSVCILFLLMSFSLANPIYLPYVLFSEIFWEEDEWTVEIWVDDYYFGEGNPIKMKSSHGEALLKQDLVLPENGIFLITADSLEQALEVDRQGDFVEFLFEEAPGYWTSDYGMHCFGNYPDAEVSAVLEGQSIVQYINYEYEVHYLVKENSPTPGYNPNNVSDCYGSLEGFVYDEDGFPVANATLKEFRFLMYTFDLTTDQDGAFEAMDIMPRNYDAVITKGNCIIHDTMLISIEPDSVTFLEITADTCIPFQAQEEHLLAEGNDIGIEAAPNPFRSKISVNITSNKALKLHEAFLKIYTVEGKELHAEKLRTPYLTDLNISLGSFIAKITPGVYILTFENSGQILASQKIIRE